MTGRRNPFLVLGLILTAALNPAAAWAAENPPVRGYRVLAVHPHDPDAFTQGLLIHDGRMFESTGQYGRSTVREVDWRTGRIVRQKPLPSSYFGEGLVWSNGRLIQLTWKRGRALVWDPDRLELIGSFAYQGQGWGLTSDGRRLFRSDGSDRLIIHDPDTFQEIGRLRVTAGGEPVRRLNELEYIDGRIWANVWQTDRLARIDPDTGEVLDWVDLGGLMDSVPYAGRIDCLNGIAHDPETGRLLVTGKYWPRLFEIELAPPSSK
jgi:glutamine cyclotransferase